MRSSSLIVGPRVVGLSAATLLMMATSIGLQVQAEPTGQLIEPIHRVAHEEAVGEAPKLASRVTVATKPPSIDLTQLPGEHPLKPALRMAQKSLQQFDANVADYSAILRKQERIDGELADEEIAFVKVRNKPFAVYMYFLQPNKGRECLYTEGPDGSKGTLTARDCGWKRRLGKIDLDPEGTLAMKGQKYPIMKLGLRCLTTELIDVATNDVQYSECEVETHQNKINGRSVTQIVVTHPTQRRNFRFYKAEVFIDNELQVPIRYVAYTWPKQPGGQPELEESYTYLNLKINNGYTDKDFDKNNPAIFK